MTGSQAPERPISWLAPRVVVLAATGVLATAAAAVALPLAVYTVSLAVFGLPHVLTELRYVDTRFRLRFPIWAWTALGAILAAIVGVRILRLADMAGPNTARNVELGLLAVLALVPVVAAPGPAIRVRGASGAVALAIGAGVVFDPALTVVALAGLHNLTPAGFLAGGLGGRTRRAALAATGVVFAAVPAVIATGWIYDVFHQSGILAPEWNPLGTAPLTAHWGVYVPAAWVGYPWAYHVFAAMVFLQCMHYATVLHVLPRIGEEGSGTVRWPEHSRFMMVVAALSGVLLLGFMWSFAGARQIYSLAAAVHAWIEIPVLCMALGAAGAAGPLKGPATSLGVSMPKGR